LNYKGLDFSKSGELSYTFYIVCG